MGAGRGCAAAVTEPGSGGSRGEWIMDNEEQIGAGQRFPCCVPGHSGQDGGASVLGAASLRLAWSQPLGCAGCPCRLPALSRLATVPSGCATPRAARCLSPQAGCARNRLQGGQTRAEGSSGQQELGAVTHTFLRGSDFLAFP